jgi:hypothetical protein
MSTFPYKVDFESNVIFFVTIHKKLDGLLLHNKPVWNVDFFPLSWLWSYYNAKIKVYKQV